MTGVDWQALGGAVVSLMIGAGGVALLWRKQAVDNARQGAEVDVIDMMRQEVKRLGDRLGAMEQREGRLIRHIYHMEAVMRAAGMNPPPFNIESDTLQAGEPR